MLVLSRKLNQKIVIGADVPADITIQVVSIGPYKVRIGIDAPPAVRVDREEIAELIERKGRRRPVRIDHEHDHRH